MVFVFLLPLCLPKWGARTELLVAMITHPGNHSNCMQLPNMHSCHTAGMERGIHVYQALTALGCMYCHNFSGFNFTSTKTVYAFCLFLYHLVTAAAGRMAVSIFSVVGGLLAHVAVTFKKDRNHCILSQLLLYALVFVLSPFL